MFNPVLAYTGLSANAGRPRHIVVVSGYRVGPEGNLWLLIDDPGSRFSKNDDGVISTWRTSRVS